MFAFGRQQAGQSKRVRIALDPTAQDSYVAFLSLLPTATSATIPFLAIPPCYSRAAPRLQ